MTSKRDLTRQLRCLIFRAMPVGRPVTASDLMYRLDEMPRGVGLHDIRNNLAFMARLGGAVHRSSGRDPAIYVRTE